MPHKPTWRSLPTNYSPVSTLMACLLFVSSKMSMTSCANSSAFSVASFWRPWLRRGDSVGFTGRKAMELCSCWVASHTLPTTCENGKILPCNWRKTLSPSVFSHDHTLPASVSLLSTSSYTSVASSSNKLLDIS